MDLAELITVLDLINTNSLPTLKKIQKRMEEELERRDELVELASKTINVIQKDLNIALTNLRRQIQPKAENKDELIQLNYII